MRFFTFIFASIIFLLSTALSHAQDNNAAVFTTPAQHLIIMDFDSGEILVEKNARVPMAPASMTKIMTASVVFDKIKEGSLSLDDEFIVSEDAWRRGGVRSGSSTMFLEPKSHVTVRDLLQGVIVQSGNDACIVLAEGIAGNEMAFAAMMNDKAKQLGLTSAHFTNATGWPDKDHVISAYDLARLAHHSIQTYPEMYKIYAQKNYTWNGITQPNRNPLITSGFAGADGLKTGHTKISKYGFVGSAVKDGKRRIFVINGLETNAQRRSESIRIMRSAFSNFSVYSLYKKTDHVGQAKVFMGQQNYVPLMVKSDVNIGLAKGIRKDLNVQIKYRDPVPAPIIAGDQIAELIINAPDRKATVVALYAANDVKKKSIFGRILASIIQKIRGE